MGATQKVLVIGDDTRSFLASVRSLGRAGVVVHAAPFAAHSPALRSRYISGVHWLPYYLGDGSEWLQAFDDLLDGGPFALVTVRATSAHCSRCIITGGGTRRGLGLQSPTPAAWRYCSTNTRHANSPVPSGYRLRKWTFDRARRHSSNASRRSGTSNCDQGGIFLHASTPSFAQPGDRGQR